MSNILDTVQISGSSYDLKDKNAPSVSAVTQQEYDNLPSSAKTSNTFFVITDAQAGDLTQYWTSAQTQSAITQATSGKVDTSSVVSSVTSASTDSEIPTAKAVYDATQSGGGGGVTVDPSLNSGSTNAVANSAITTAINAVSGAIPTTYVSNVRSDNLNGVRFFQWEKNNNGSKSYTNIWNFKINNNNVLTSSYNGNVINYNLVETSAITTSVTSSSTDAQVPSAKAVYDAIQEGGGGTVDQTIISGSTNAVAGGAVYDKFDEVEQVTAAALNNINDRLSEDEEVTAAGLNAVNDKFGGLKLNKLTQAEYDALATKDASTLYIIVN